MLRLRHQLPVYSPIPGRALLAALRPRGARAALGETLRARYAADEVVLCGSGTQALQLALSASLSACGWGDVALPGFTCYDVASAAIGAGARVRLYDVDPYTLSPDPGSVEAALRGGARVVVVAPLYGVPVRWGELEALAASHGAVLVEDAAQGSGASWRGVPLGGLGPVSVLSLGRGKGWTGGGGGAVLLRGAVRTPPALTRARGSARELAGAAMQWAIGRPAVYGLPLSIPGLGLGETRYHAPVWPAEIPAGAAALALATRAASDAETEARREHARELLEVLAAAPAASTVRLPAGAVAGYLRLPVRLPRGLGSFANPARALRLGVGRSYPTTLAEVPALRGRMANAPSLPGAEQLVRELVTLPVHSRVRAGERAELLAAITAIPAAPGATPVPSKRR